MIPASKARNMSISANTKNIEVVAQKVLPAVESLIVVACSKGHYSLDLRHGTDSWEVFRSILVEGDLLPNNNQPKEFLRMMKIEGYKIHQHSNAYVSIEW